MSKQAWLDNDQLDLRELARPLPSGDICVVCEGDRYYLTSEIDNPPAGTQFYEVAARLIIQINGIARANDPSFRSVRLSDTYTDGETT